MKLVAIKPVQSSTGALPVGIAFNATEAQAAGLIASGHAVREEDYVWWDGLKWPDSTVAILASGPSLTVAQCEAVRRWQGDGRKVIAINTTYQRAPWADVLYACDFDWWKVYRDDVAKTFHGELWSQDERAKLLYVRWVKSEAAPGLGKRPGVIHQGANSGYQAVNLAYQAGAKKIILLGMDMGGSHWHGDHPRPLKNTAPHTFERWINGFDKLAADLKQEGVEVVNCSPSSALECFPKMELSQAL